MIEGSGEKLRQRHRDHGRLLPREQLDLLLDRDSPFLELGALAGWGTDDPLGGSVVLGIGIIEGIECLVAADDLTEPGLGVSPTGMIKARRGHELALHNRLPLVNLVEPHNPGRGVQAHELVPGGATFKELSLLSTAGIPTITVVFGAPEPTLVADPGMSDHLIIVPDPTGSASTIGGPDGVTAEVASNEIDGLRLARQFVRNLNWRKLGPGPTSTPAPPELDTDELIAVPSGDVSLPYEVREVVWRIVDGSRFDDSSPASGRSWWLGSRRCAGSRSGSWPTTAPSSPTRCAREPSSCSCAPPARSPSSSSRTSPASSPGSSPSGRHRQARGRARVRAGQRGRSPTSP